MSTAPLDTTSLSTDSIPSASDRPSRSAPSSAPESKANKSKSYTEQLKEDFEKIFDSLNLDSPDGRKASLNKAFLKSRWLDQILWMEAKSAQCRNRHFRLRLITIIGGVIVPILVTFNVDNQRLQDAIKQATIVISGAVAVTAAIEEFFQYGKRWYNYRRSAESLKAQGWHFFQLSGPYRTYPSHHEAFQAFAENIEEIIQHDVETYVTQNQQNKQGQGQQSSQENSDGDQAVI
ncbi:DUF4231 domain-containing protein [Oscillatoria sp. FACHB-1407]|nr:DUF4231 domain-containing protein [Oscillatoria sp. FACHB-1407]